MKPRTPRRGNAATSSPPNFFVCLGTAELDRAIEKLERLVCSLERQAHAAHIARGYREALELAHAERERRMV